jgi:hypothetical protein
VTRGPFADELRQLGYGVRKINEGVRILARTIVEKLTLTSCEEMTEGSTKPVAEVRRHAAIARVLLHSFTIS